MNNKVKRQCHKSNNAMPYIDEPGPGEEHVEGGEDDPHGDNPTGQPLPSMLAHIPPGNYYYYF